MATRYVRKTGSDSNGGTSPSDAWLTIGKALSTLAAGDVCYVGAGTYRETVTVTITPATEVQIIGDEDGAQTGDAGPVIWTSYTTNDKTAASASGPLNLNGSDHLTFKRITFISGLESTYVVSGSTATSQFITFQDCTFQPGPAAGLTATTTFGVPFHWLIDRCSFTGGWPSQGPVTALTITAPTGTGSDYDLDFVIQNCLIDQGQVQVNTSGTSANRPGGVIVRNCTVIGHTGELLFNSTRLSTSIPCQVKNCFIWTSTGIVSLTVGGVVEDYNVFDGQVTNTNITPGTHSINDHTYAPLVDVGTLNRLELRPYCEPMAGSPLLGFGDDGTAPSVDLLGRPRPAGGPSALKAVGCLERGNTWGKETGTVRTGTNALSITGPGYQDFDIPVDAVSTTVAVYLRRDSTYAGTAPRLQVIKGGEAGVADASATDGGAANAWNLVSLNFTPARKGIVTVRLLSSDTNGGGKAFADDLAVT